MEQVWAGLHSGFLHPVAQVAVVIIQRIDKEN